VTLLFGGGLHYGQEFFGEELCTWMKNSHGCQGGDTFFEGEFSGGQVSRQPQTLRQETWPPENPNFLKDFLLVFPLLRHTIPSHVLGSNS